MRFADRTCGGGASRMARQVGLGRALEIFLSARDFDAETAEKYGTINRAMSSAEIGPFVDELAARIANFPSDSRLQARHRQSSDSLKHMSKDLKTTWRTKGTGIMLFLRFRK
eukprot:GHVN01056036.1.p2 GENE.GHVN01056036.1~~GHVN01056036.1.p2  ORF type:complete len:112 (+),score=16.87 GHVN01056036.1:437-772(+)